MHTNPILRPFEPHLHHFSFGKWERSLSVRVQLICVRKRGSSINFGMFLIPKPNLQVNKNLSSSKTQNFTDFTIFYLDSKHISLDLKTFFYSSNSPWDRPSKPRLHLHFSYKIHEGDFIFYWNTFPHDSACTFMSQIWNFWSKFQFYTWNWLFGMDNKIISFSIKSSHIFKQTSW